jgi:GntR family transcriptional regulator/MocR family aminotransferase
MARHARPVDLPLNLPPAEGPSGTSLRHRIADAIVGLLRSGQLQPGDQLPASRALAAELRVSRTAVLGAYDELAAAGFIHATGGSSTVVSPGADQAAMAGVATHVSAAAATACQPSAGSGEPRLSLLSGYPDTGLIDPGAWRSAWRSAAAYPASSGLPWADPGRPLAAALATHLRRARGVVADPDAIMLAPGVSAALRAVAVAARLCGRPVAFEDPGYPQGRDALASAGAVIRPVPVDQDGLDPATLADDHAAVYTTPAHQYPLGARMPAARRAALIKWARRAGGLVIEDDYDGEFRYDVSGLPALHSLSEGPEVVVYIGTASKMLSPDLRLAWIIAPKRLRDPVRAALFDGDVSVSVPAALALAAFTTSGNLTRHLARAAREYAARRHALIAALRDAAPDLPVTGVDAGLHLVAGLPPGTDEVAVQRQLRDAGIAVDILSQFTVNPSTARALVCGYSLLPQSQARHVAAQIAAAVRAHS